MILSPWTTILLTLYHNVRNIPCIPYTFNWIILLVKSVGYNNLNVTKLVIHDVCSICASLMIVYFSQTFATNFLKISVLVVEESLLINEIKLRRSVANTEGIIVLIYIIIPRVSLTHWRNSYYFLMP